MEGVFSIENLLIIGSGLMGTGIAQYVALNGKAIKSIVIYDVSEKQLQLSKDKVAQSLKQLKSKKGEISVLLSVISNPLIRVYIFVNNSTS